jgi:two-component system response regulator
MAWFWYRHRCVNPTIVVVEDDPNDQALILRALRKAGLDAPVLVANDGAEALDAIARSAEPPRLVLLDLGLPGVDGRDVLRALRSSPDLVGLPIVVLSSSDEPSDIATSYALGANGYVTKPRDGSGFSQRVGDIGRYWSQVNEVVT